MVSTNRYKTTYTGEGNTMLEEVSTNYGLSRFDLIKEETRPKVLTMTSLIYVFTLFDLFAHGYVLRGCMIFFCSERLRDFLFCHNMLHDFFLCREVS